MNFYMIAETIENYMFVNVAKDTEGDSKKVLIIATQGFGLLVTPHVKKRHFILISAIIMLIAFIWILFGGLRSTYGVFIIAVLFGFGIGNLWPAIYSYSIDIDERRASYIGMVINIVSMFWIPITQLVVALIWTQHDDSLNSSALYYLPQWYLELYLV